MSRRRKRRRKWRASSPSVGSDERRRRSASRRDRRLSSAAITDTLHSLRIDAVVQPITFNVAGVASHAEDDDVLATALSAEAPYLVTGDKPLLHLERGAYRGTRLLTPRQFLTVLNETG